MSHNLKINGVEYSAVDKLLIPNTDGEDVEFIVPSGNKSIAANGTHDVTSFAKAIVNVSDSQHFAFGYKTMTANTDFSVTGITDQQGNSFTPKGYAFTLLPDVSANFTGGSASPSLIACVFDSVTGKQTRTRSTDVAWRAFANIGSSSAFQVGDGYFKQVISSDTKYNCWGAKYFWVAWG